MNNYASFAPPTQTKKLNSSPKTSFMNVPDHLFALLIQFPLQIYAMTLRMSELFEEQVKPIISRFKSAKKRADNQGSPTKKKNTRPKRNNGGPSTSQDNHNHNSGDSDDDDEDNHKKNGRVNGRSRRTHAQSNGVSSSSHTRDSQRANKTSRRPRAKSSADEEESNSDDSTADESSEGSDESSGVPIAELSNFNTRASRKTFRKKSSQQTRGAVSR